MNTTKLETEQEVYEVALSATMLLDAGLSFEEAQMVAEYSYIDSIQYGDNGVLIRPEDTVSNLIWDHFLWTDTPQGYNYWNLLATKYTTTPLIASLYETFEDYYDRYIAELCGN
jgi:hypothetical protein